MLRVLGSPRGLCDRMSRRDWLRIGGIGLAGLGLADVARLQDAAAATAAPRAPSFGRAKSLILIHLYGSPSQMEWVDPKPNAPVEIRGELGSIPSSLPGCDVCELVPKFSRVVDRCTVFRSMTHPYPIHGVAYALTGVQAIDVPMELNPRDARHWPYFGSVVDYVDSRSQPADAAREIPRNMALPFRFSSRRVGEVPRAGPYAAFLGGQYDPVWTDFVGQATRGYRKWLVRDFHEYKDPYMGVADGGHFVVPSATGLEGDVTLDRMDRRRSLLEQFESRRGDLARTAAGEQMDRYRQMTYDLVTSTKLRDALDIRREDASVRERYGDSLFGQSCLAARRLVEAGGRVVSVFWDEYGQAGSGWDTHSEHYARMRKELCPGWDTGFSALLLDLEERGMLDDTLVVCTSEHGRTPKINRQIGGGRDHWSRVYSTIAAGAGMARGRVIGASDRDAGDVLDRPVSPKELLATMYHLLGIDHHTIVHDRLGRPTPLVDAPILHDALA